MGSAAIAERAAPGRVVSFNRAAAPVAVAQFPTCSSCVLHATCIPRGMAASQLASMDQVVASRRRVRRGEHLYHAGDPFKSIFAFRSGFFKSYVDGPDGQSQVIDFPMAGEVVGLDGIDAGVHRLNVVALDDGEVCVIPYDEGEGRSPALQHQLNRMMSREIVRGQDQMTLLAGMRADARVATFLLGLSAKFAARGYSSTQFHLRMTRDEIGSYLGLKLETISRVLSRFQEKGLITAHLRSIVIVDVGGLRAFVPAQ